AFGLRPPTHCGAAVRVTHGVSMLPPCRSAARWRRSSQPRPRPSLGLAVKTRTRRPEVVMIAQTAPIIPPAPKVHAKDLPGWRLLLQFSRNTVSTLPDYAFDVLISRRRVLGFDSLLLNDPDGVRHVLTTAMEKYKRLVSTHRVLAPLGGNGLFLAAGSQWRRQRRALAPVFSPANVGILLPHFVAAATGTA